MEITSRILANIANKGHMETGISIFFSFSALVTRMSELIDPVTTAGQMQTKIEANACCCIPVEL